MKRILFLAMLVSTGAFAQQTISTSKHNFGSQANAPNAYTTGETQICKYCHVPHKALTTGSLWSHTATTQVYTAYGTTQRGTALTQTSVTPDSRLCMDCHDGTVALGDLALAADVTTFTGASVDTTTKRLLGTAASNVGTNLASNHPIGVTYPTATGYRAPTGAAVVNGTETLPLTPVGANNTVECSTCHEPHNNVGTGNTKMLRVSSGSSAICLHCHLK